MFKPKRILNVVTNSSKVKIPKSLREQVWIHYNGTNFNSKCAVSWCKNILTPFTFHAGHNIPESKGGRTDITNLKPICSSCNLSMGNSYTIDQFSDMYKTKDETIQVNKVSTRSKKSRLIWCVCRDDDE